MENPMEENTTKATPLLEIAWLRHAQLDAAATKRSKSHRSIRRWIATFGVLATLFAILTEIYPTNFPATGSVVLKILLIVSPITASALAAYTNKFFSNGDWLIARAGAEEIKKEIYMFRSILQKAPNRRVWLEKRLMKIQRKMFRGMNGELVLEPYVGPIPPGYSPDDPFSDPGFNDLIGNDYYKYRLEHQLTWHIKSVNKNQHERTRLQVFILAFGSAGAVLAALGGPFSLWVALTASLTAAFIGWQELRALDTIIRNYSKVIMELTLLYDHWNNLEPEERSDAEYFQMVSSTEEILWGQNVEYIKSMQEVLKEADLSQEAGLINRILKESVDADARFKQSLSDAVVEQTSGILTEAQEALTERFKEALGTLAEEASSELVQAELAAMGQAISETVQAIAQAAGIADKLKELADEFAGVEIGRDTPTSVLNDLMSRYPKSNEVKG
jgi:hypothetical protein